MIPAFRELNLGQVFADPPANPFAAALTSYVSLLIK